MGVVCALLGVGCERAAAPEAESATVSPATTVSATPAPESPSTDAPAVKTLAAEPLARGRMPLEAAPAGMRAAWYAARQAAAAEDPRFTLRPLGDTLLAVPALRGPGAVFAPAGVGLGGVEAALRTTGYRCDAVTRAAGLAAPHMDATRPNRATYTHGETPGRFDAWYVHGPEGLEQGFDVDDPACRGTLRLEIALSGFTATPADAEGRVKLTPATGGAALWYQDAAARDARGKGLPVHLEGAGAALAVVVDVRGAAFPVQIDPMLVVDSGGPPRPDEVPGDGAINDKLGTSVAIDGDTAVVGAEKDGVGPTLNQGSAYVFVRTNGNWALEGKLVAADGAADDNFGHSVALSGNTAVVGANLDDANLIDQGSAYVFTRTNGVWTQQQKLLAAAPSIGDQFGGSVSVDADVAIVGASLDDVGANANMGSATVFARTNGVWAQQALLTPSDGSGSDNFGVSVAVSGGTAVVGANQDDTGVKSDHGSAYVFTRNGNAWPQTQKLVAPDSATGDGFGLNVAIDADTIAAAATNDDVGAATDEGTVYVYLRTNGVWALQDQLNALDLVNNLRFGLSLSLDANTLSIVATGALAYVFVRDVNSGTWLQEARLLVPANAVTISGDTTIFGFSSENVSGNNTQGSIYAFNRSNGAWGFPTNLTTGDGDQADQFGTSVALSGNTAVIGVPGDHVLQATARGAAYVFVENGGVWTREARLIANDGAQDDGFGNSVALDGDTAVVGASLDDVGAVADQGSAYVFNRVNGVWTQAQRLNAAGGAATDLFGTSVAISGDTVVIGAPQDDVGAAANQGSAYVFLRTAGVWAQQTQLVAADGAGADTFGRSVAVSGETALVGSPQDDLAVADAGSAYVFLRTAGVWAQQSKLASAVAAANDFFGTAVALSGDTALVGAPQDDVLAAVDQGTATVFLRTGVAWAPQATLVAADGTAGDQFGVAVAIDGNTAVIGAAVDAVGALVGAGAAYATVRTGASWCLQTRFVARDAAAGDRFGSAVAVSGARLLVGAPKKAGGVPFGNPNEGRAYASDLDRNLLPNGQACGCAGECQSGICTEGVCCNAACDGGTCDSCTAEGTVGQCVIFAAGTECRAAGDVCDVAEVCDGNAAACPADAVQVQGQECRAAGDVCDLAEVCDGTNKACPNDAMKPLNTECRAATDVCDAAEVCTGAAKACPNDRVKAVNTECRAATDLCDAAEVCNGTLKTCPADVLKAANAVCRAAAGTCDTAEVCNGLVRTCPEDVIKGAGVECRAAAGVCDAAETCDGLATACPADIPKVAGIECRAAAGVCDNAEVCNGVVKTCPADTFKNNATECRAPSDLCDAAEMCPGNAAACPVDRTKAVNTVCRAASDVCDQQEVCNGVAKTCPVDAVKAVNTACRAASDLCDAAEVCDGADKACPVDAVKAPGVSCRVAVGVCDEAETCDGAAKACPADVPKAAGVECRAANGACDNAEACDGAVKTCPADAFKNNATECRPAADLCDAAELCPGNAPACPADANKAAGVTCRAASDLCDAAETCSGVAKTCPVDAVKAVNTACRAASDVCDTGEVCDGNAKACPPDAVKGAGVECRVANGACDAAEACDGAAKACPVDAFKGAGVECRAVAGTCDTAEACTGVARDCPADAFKNNATECRPASDLCDAAELCPGNAPACPADANKAAGVTCRAASDLCDAAETCSGAVKTCPVDAVKAANTACRAASDLCDAGEVCDGAVKSCPVDAVKGAGVECRAADGACDTAEACNGALKTCPVDAVKGVGVTCRAAVDVCDAAEACNGALKTCPADLAVPAGTECRPAQDACDAAEACNGVLATCPVDRVAGLGTECRAAVGPCDAVEACDGQAPTCPEDELLGPDAECAPPACADGFATPPAFCDGATIDCAPAVSESCGDYACGETTCLVECLESAECAAGAYCDQGLCLPLAEDGAPCDFPGACASGFCVDGVCCDQGCGGQCEACNEPEAPGLCVPVAGDPRGDRAPCATDESVCGGVCDGGTPESCFYPADESPCRDAACAGGVATLEAACAGDGTCPALQTQACAPFMCGATACLGDCVADADCAPGLFCSAGVCGNKRADGAACGRDEECGSNHCVDGVCCNAACGGQCEACDVAGHVGACVTVPFGSPHGGRAPCSGGGLCAGECTGNARNACEYPAAETTCLPATCAEGVASPASSCDGAGSCVVAEGSSCGAYACGPGGCLEACASADDCAVGFFCVAGACTALLPEGAACERPDQCGTGFCVDGLCCDRACGGQCEACDTAGAAGECRAVAGAPHGARSPCATDGGACGGTCDGRATQACTYPGAQATCRPPRCRDGVATVGATCDGAGACAPEQTVDCAPFACGPISCLGNCVADADCLEGLYCAAGVCSPRLALGERCAETSQCAEGFCVDGVCCDTRCLGQCEACDVPGNAGTCSVVVDAPPHGGRRACTGVGLCQGLCTGERRDVCGYPGQEIVCRPGDCSNGVATPESACDGTGACRRGARSNCGAYACGAMGCLERCADVTDCAAGFECVDFACVDPATPVADALVPPVDAGLMPDAGPVATPDAGPVVTPDAGPVVTPPDAGPVITPDAGPVVTPPDAGPVVVVDARPQTDGPQTPDFAVHADDKGRLGDGPLPADAAPPTADLAPPAPDLGPVVVVDARPGITGDAAPEGDATTGPGEGGDDQGTSEAAGLAQGGGCQCRSAGGGVGALWLPGLLLLWLPLRRRRPRA
jgi:hypothetical protein